MENNFTEIIADNSEILIDSLLDNEIIKEIPILGTSLKMYRGIQTMREKFYVGKVKKFVESINEFDTLQRDKLINESRRNEKSRKKFGDAMFSTIEQSDSDQKVIYLAHAFEAFVNSEIDESDLRKICHIIKITFIDELSYIVEDDKPMHLEKYYYIGLSEAIFGGGLKALIKGNTPKQYQLSKTAIQLRKAWNKYK